MTTTAPVTPETLSQAKEFDRNFLLWRASGLCVPCASQGAWGQQMGMTEVRPPCRTCKGRVAHERASRRATQWIQGEIESAISDSPNKAPTAGEAHDPWGSDARKNADKEMDRIARMPVALRETGAHRTAAQQAHDMPTNWINEPKPGYPWTRPSSTLSEWRDVNGFG